MGCNHSGYHNESTCPHCEVRDLRARLAACEKERDEARARVCDVCGKEEGHGHVWEDVEVCRGCYEGKAHHVAIVEKERDAAIARAEKAEKERDEAWADYARCAEAAGIEYVQDQGPSYPGPPDDVVRAIDEHRHAYGRVIDAENERDAARAEAAALREALERIGCGVGVAACPCSTTARTILASTDAGRALLDEVRGLREADAECKRQHETSKQEGADATRASIVAEARRRARSAGLHQDTRALSEFAGAIERREDEKR